jgi:hypothetical protein
MNFSNEARIIIGIMLITIPTVEFGGVFLLSRLRKQSGFNENGVQGHYFRAGHAHAGVLLILGIIAQVLVDQTSFALGLAYAVRAGFFLPPIMISAGFFLGAPGVEGKPKPLLTLVYIGGILLALSTVVLGLGLVFNS